MQKVTVLYVAGTGRSGSTLLGNLLGQVPGVFAAGEMNNIFRRGLQQDWYCGCGVRFSSCSVWTEVLARAYGPSGVDVPGMVAAGERLGRVRRIPLLLASHGRPDRLGPGASGYLARLDALYRAAAAATGASVIVDSSKSPSYGFLLGTLASVDLRVLHLVRDPRGAAFSWQRRRLRSDGAVERPMQRMSAVKASTLWGVWNTAVEAMCRRSGIPYLRVRYEDLVADPAAALRAALSHASVDVPALGFLSPPTAHLEPCHSISGNPVRLQTGEVSLKPDLEWRSAMPLRRQLLVTALTVHSLGRYGYPLRPSRQLSLSRRS